MTAAPAAPAPPGSAAALHEHELAVLNSVYEHRMLTTIQLTQLHSPSERPRWLRAVTARLRALGLLDYVEERSRRQLRCWFVTAAGADAVEVIPTGQRSRRVLVTTVGAASQLQAHTLAVNDVGIAFVRWARHYGHECGPLAWRNEVAHRIGDGGGGVRAGDLLVADAVIDYAAADDHGRVRFVTRFVELDRATMSVQEVGEKLRRYVQYADYVPKNDPDGRRAWQRRYPALPGAVMVLTGASRQRLLTRRHMILALCASDPQLAEATTPTIAVTLLEELQRHGPFAGVFRRPGDPDGAVDLLGRPLDPPAPEQPALLDTGAAS